jgi:hypothetical protein
MFNSVDNLQASQLLLSKAARERKDLEAIVAKYQEETRILEEEIVKLEDEELEIIAKMMAIKEEKAKLEQKLGEKDAILAGILAENDALRSEMAHSMKLLDEAKKAQASLLESVPVAAVSPKELEEKTKEFEVARVNMANQLNTKRVQIDKHENKIQQLEQLISNVVPANTTVDQHIDQLTTEIKAIESQNLTISGAKNILFEKIKAAKKELTNLLADKGYLINQKNNHLDNKAKYEKEMSVATSPKEKQLIQEKISQMLMNLKVIEDNIVVNEKNLAQEADKVAKFEQQIQAYDKESSANDAAIEARKAEIKEIGSSNKALVQLKKEKEDLEKERELGQTNLRILEQNFNAFKTKAEQSQKLPPEVDKALSKNRQQISRLEGLILNNRHKLEANEKKSKEVATEAEQLKQLLGQKEQKVHEIDQKMGGIAQKKTEARHKIEDLKMNPPQSIAHNLPDLRDHINLDESMGPERKELKSILKKSSHEIVDMSPLAAQKLYPPSEFVPNDYTQVLASETAPVTRRKLTSRLFEIRANLKEYGKDIETKDENIKSLKEKLLGNREVITNFHNILGQKSELVEHVENRITRNVSIIQENKKLFAENAQKIQQNREAIEKNYQEIKDINSEFKRFTTVVAAEPFAFDGRAKDMVSKKIQTSVNQVSESRCQTDLDSGDIENLEKRAKQKHIIKINESAAAVAARKNSRMEQGIGVDEPFAPRKSKDVVNFAQTQTTNTSFKITRDAEVGENKLFGEAKIGTEEPLKEKIELDEKKQRGDFGKKPFVEQAVSADLLSPRASGGQKRELESPATAPLVYTRYPAVLKKDKKDSIGFIKRNPPIDPEIFPEIEMIGSNRLKHLVRAEPKKPPKTYSENMVVDFNTSSPNPEEQARDNMEEMSFGNFETERASIVKARTQKVLEIDNIFEFLIPRSGPQDASPLVSQSQKFYTKFADHSRTTNVKKLSKLLAMEALIRGKGNYQVSMALIDIVNAAKAQKRAEDRKNFEIARSVSINNKKARVPFQLKALKEDKLRKNKTFCNTMYHVFREHLKTYFFNLAEGIALTSTKVELQAEHKKELAIATNYHVAKMTSIRKAKGTFDGFLSRTIFRRLNQAFHRIFDFAQKRNQNFFKKFVPVMVRADENMKNLLMDVLQYWYNVRGESNWTQRIFRHFIFKASLTNQIAALRLKMYKKKPSKKGSAMREFAQKLSVVLSKQSHRLLADGFKLVEQVKRLRPKKEASFILSQASAEIEGLKGPDDDSERDEILKRYELMLSQQEMRAINLNMKIINGRVCEALRRQAGFAFRNILYSKRR